MKQYVYMKVTTDKYELPVAVADSVKGLSNLVGATANSIRTCIWRNEHGDAKSSSYRRVEIDEMEQEAK